MASSVAQVASLKLRFKKAAQARAVDPLALEEQRMAANLREGLSTLLEMHNPAELGSLCGSLGLVEECEFGTAAEKKAAILRYLGDEGMRLGSQEKAHMRALKFVWDGILYEYLRAEGQPVRSSRVDPRTYTLQLWRKRAAAATGGDGTFRPRYLPRHAKRRCDDPSRAEDLEGMLRGVETMELAVKHAEAKVRNEKDHRHVLTYLADVMALHEYERDARDYLTHELESLRARVDHYHSSLELTANQLTELEKTYDDSTSVLVQKLSRSEAELSWLQEAAAVEVATERQHVAASLLAFLSIAGAADGTLTLDPPAPWLKGEDQLVETALRSNVERRQPITRDLGELCAHAAERYERDVAVVWRRAEAADAAFTAAYAAYDHVLAACSFQTARAVDAETCCRQLRAQLAVVTDHAAREAAKPLAELESLKGLVDRVVADLRAADARANQVLPLLWSLLGVDSRRVAGLAAQATFELELVPTLDVAWQQIERWNMDREEVQLRTALALQGPTPTTSKKKKKKAATKKKRTGSKAPATKKKAASKTTKKAKKKPR